jgi:hypothetical protein
MSLRSFSQELWARNGYGTAAHAMIRQFPVSGVGVGSFNGFVAEFGERMGLWLPPDNAQSWLRQQVAELGVVGALGWILWSVSFGVFLLTPRAVQPPGAWTMRATLLTFGAVSLVAVHGQDLMVAITFWTFAVWYVGLIGMPPVAPRLRTRVWVAMMIALGIFATSSVASAAGALGLPSRALRLKAPLSYGFAPPDLSGVDAGFRRTQARALALIDAAPGWMSVAVRRADLGVAAPVDVRVSCDGQVILKATLTHLDPVMAFVPVKRSDRVLLETSARYVSEVWLSWWRSRPEVLVKWEFGNHPPPGFRGYQGVSSTSE